MLVEARALLNTKLLRNRNLDMVDVILVPLRLKQRIRKPQHHQVLDRFFSEVVVDTVDLLFFKVLSNGVVNRLSSIKVVTDRFLQNDLAVTLYQAGVMQSLTYWRVQVRPRGHVVKPVDVFRRQRLTQVFIALMIIYVVSKAMHFVQKPLQRFLFEVIRGHMRFY